MKFFRNVILGSILLSLCALQPATAQAITSTEGRWFYINPGTLSPLLLPAPPASGSPEEKVQIEVIITRAQKDLTSADLTAMRDEQHVRLELMTQMLGPDFTREQKPKTFALLDRVMVDTRNLSDHAKNFWHTQRPYLVDRRVKLRIDPLDNSPAYPSGHTCFSWVMAEVLGMLYPDQAAALRARADVIAWHRVQAGVHYPVDLDGGRFLAMQIVGALMQNDAFQEDFAAARQEASLPK